MKHICSTAYRLWQKVRRWKIRIGCHPCSCPPFSFIIFPSIPEKLCCGLAGILTLKGNSSSSGDENAIQLLRDCFETVRQYGLDTIVQGKIPLSDYLSKGNALQNMEQALCSLKQKPDLSYLYHDFFTDEMLLISQAMQAFLQGEEDLIERRAHEFSTRELEEIQSALASLKDMHWALEKDILSNIAKIRDLADVIGEAEVFSRNRLSPYNCINLLLNSLDKLEVRGRDSAGIQISFVIKNGNDFPAVFQKIKDQGLFAEYSRRQCDGDLRDGSIMFAKKTTGDYTLSFTYKKASITGALGENGRYLRAKIRSDAVLRTFLEAEQESSAYLAHTRWASVGAISEENCHPLNNHAVRQNSRIADCSSGRVNYPFYGPGNWLINAVLNGDIDNYRHLRSSLEVDGDVAIGYGITTDTKIIPLWVERYLCEGYDLKEAFRRAVNDFEGSHAIALQSNLEPGRLFLALKGSGQSIYVGLAESNYIFASEIYGIVEHTSRFLQMDGEHERIPGDSRTKGQIFILCNDCQEPLQGIKACSYDGTPLKLDERHVRRAQITTRDIDRKGYSHYLLKEILDAPLSVRKTLRGKYRISAAGNGNAPAIDFNLGTDFIPGRLRQALEKRTITTVFVIGQGTAGIAAAAIADAFRRFLKNSQIRVEAHKASELSGFHLDANMENTLVIAVTQSGTTTDTNRAVAMAKERGAHLLAIVNRRQSDITQKVEGVLYTSDGRDIEMSVASTKAFYSQITAGYILALFCAQVLKTVPDKVIDEVLHALESAPDLMLKVISGREKIKHSAWEIVKKKRYWAVVGSGPNKVAADEIRIKLSELCYKTISSDTIEDKKHIDLSAEPLILACTAGNPESVLEDIAKDIEIFKAHEAGVVVVAEEGDTRFDAVVDSVLFVPAASFPVSVILNTLAGHIWGYYAACSINEEADFFRSFRTALSSQTMEMERKKYSVFEYMADQSLHRLIEDFSSEFHNRRNKGYFSSLGVEVISDIVLLLKYGRGRLPLEEFWVDFKGKRTSSSPLDMLDISLGKAIDELARPIDAIRHQAKTVTVGTSRREESIQGILFELLGKLSFSLESLSSRNGIVVKRLQKAVAAVTGYTLYAVEGLDNEGRPQATSKVSISAREGVSLGMQSRVSNLSPLMGTKKTIINSGSVYAGLGKYDKAPIIIIPLMREAPFISNVLLVHVCFNANLTVEDKKEIIGEKLIAVTNQINEYNLSWNDRYLEPFGIEFLLGEGTDTIVAEIMAGLS